jgi:hypothetical protein
MVRFQRLILQQPSARAIGGSPRLKLAFMVVWMLCARAALQASCAWPIFDASSNSATISGEASLSFAHTCSGIDPLLIVSVGTHGNTAVESITYHGVSLSPLLIIPGSGNPDRLEFWFLVGPTLGPASVTVTTAAKTDIEAGAVSYDNVDQAAPFGSKALKQGNGTAMSIPLTTTASNSLIVGAVHGDQANLITSGSGQSQRMSQKGKNANLAMDDLAAGSPQGYIMDYTFSSPMNFSSGAIEVMGMTCATVSATLTPPPAGTPSATPHETQTITPEGSSTASPSATSSPTWGPSASPSPNASATWSPTPRMTMVPQTIDVEITVRDASGRIWRSFQSQSDHMVTAFHPSCNPFDPAEGSATLTDGGWAVAFNGLDDGGKQLPNDTYSIEITSMAGGTKTVATHAITISSGGDEEPRVVILPSLVPKGHGTCSVMWFPPMAAEIKLFSLSGGLLRLYHVGAGAGRLDWDLRNGTGQLAAPGLYLIAVRREDLRRPRIAKVYLAP